MERNKIKRVAIVAPTGERMYYPEEYFSSLSDDAILCAIHEVGKTVWRNGALYLVKYTPDSIVYWRYEVYTVSKR